MRRGIIAAIIMFIFCLHTPALAEESPSKIYFSTDRITVGADSSEFAVDIIAETNEPFSSAEFGLKLQGRLEIKSVEYAAALDNASKVPVLEKNGIYYFGFFSDQNQYSGKIKLCKVHVQYAGSASASMTMEEATIVAITGTGGAVKNSIHPELKVAVNRRMNASSNDQNGSSGEITKPTFQAESGVVTVEPQVSNGKASVKLNSDIINQALEQATTDAHGMKTIEINMMQSGSEAKEFSTELPAQIFSLEENHKIIKIHTPAAAVTLPFNMLPKNQLGNAQNVELNVSIADISQLPEAAKEQIGDRPVIEIHIALDGKRLEWENEEVPVALSIPYTPNTEEIQNPDRIVAYYIDGNGKLHVVSSGRYNADTGRVAFSVTHFSQYGIGFAVKSFEDIKGMWAREEIEALAVRGIIDGTSEDTYSPDAKITRADFTKLLVGVLNKTTKPETGFIDVIPSDYYYEAVSAAKALGLAEGTGQNAFNPQGQITRQDMMVLIHRALIISGKPLAKKADLSAYTDADHVADYAKDSAAKLAGAGIIQGSDGKLRPNDSLTRAEAARVLYLVYTLLY